MNDKEKDIEQLIYRELPPDRYCYIHNYIVDLKKQLQQKENIIKEVREYIENNSLYEQDYTYDYEENIEEFPPDDTKARKELLEILDKVSDK